MDFETKFIVAISLVIFGSVSGFLKIQQYRNNPSQALKEDLIDAIADLLPQFIFSVLLVLVGIGWLYYLLTTR